MSEVKLDLLYLDRQQVIDLGGKDMTLAVQDMENIFCLFEQDDVRVPDKVSMNFGKTIAEEKTLGRINAMPGYVGGDYNMAGMKWIGSNPANLKNGLPRASAITILNDPDTKFPLVLMDGTEISNTRTGAVVGVAIKYLAKKDSKKLLVFGAGLVGEKVLEAAVVGCPGLDTLYIFDIVPERAASFAEEMTARLGVKVVPVSDAKECARSCDIVVTATGASSPVLDKDFIPEGALYVNLGGYECTYDTVANADKRFVDNWKAVKHRNTSPIAKMANEGVLDEEKQLNGEIGAVILGRVEGRASDEETIYFNCVGMGIEDIAIATRVYNKAKAEGVGTTLRYW